MTFRGVFLGPRNHALEARILLARCLPERAHFFMAGYNNDKEWVVWEIWDHRWRCIDIGCSWWTTSPANKSRLVLRVIFGTGQWPIGWVIRWTHPLRPDAIVGRYREGSVRYTEGSFSWDEGYSPTREYRDLDRDWTPEVLEP